MPGESHGERSQAGYSPWGRKRVTHDLVAKTSNNEKHTLNKKGLYSINSSHGEAIEQWVKHGDSNSEFISCFCLQGAYDLVEEKKTDISQSSRAIYVSK